MMRVRTSTIVFCAVVSVVVGVSSVAAQQARTPVERAEELGIDRQPVAGVNPAPAPGERKTVRDRQLPDFLLIPDSTADRVMSFDPMTGNLLDADFIPADPTNLSTPICAILGPGNDSILVSDQIDDVVQEYDLDGNYINIYAPAGGPNNAIVDNMRGIALRANGNLLITVASGTNDDAIAEFDGSGTYLGNFITNGLGGLDSPWEIAVRATDVLASGGNSDAVHQYDTSGNYLGDVITTVINFPEQVAEAANGNFLVAGFSTPSGVHEFLPDGTFVATYNVVTGCRGVYELGNGNILVTNGSGVHEINRSNILVETKISGVSARFIELISGAIPVELQSFSVD